MTTFTVNFDSLQFMPRKVLFILIDDSASDANPWTWTDGSGDGLIHGSADEDTYDLEGKIEASEFLDIDDFTFTNGGFSPIDLSPAVWLDVSDISTLFTDDLKTTPVTSDGDVVGAWADKSGNGDDALQTVGGDKPLYKTGIQNELPALLCDGAGDHLATVAFSEALSQPNTIVYVARSNSGQGAQFYFHDGIGVANRNATLVNTTSAPDGWRLFAGAFYNTANVMTRDAFIMFEGVFNGASSEMYEDGALIEPAGDSGANTLTGLTVGGRHDGIQTLTGYMAEYIVIPRLLTVTERASLTTYLNSKWAVF